MTTIDTTRGGGLLAALGDGLTVLQRNLLKFKHQPGQIVATFAFPLISVILFGYVFGSAIPISGGVDYREYLMPGLFVMGTVFGLVGSLTVIAKDNGLGVMDRFRSMPMSRIAVPFGQTAADLLIAAGSLLVMAGCGLLFGWRAHNGLGATLGAFGLLLLLQYAVSWIGVYFGSLVKDEETAAKISPLVMPVTMISNVFVPTEGMPAILRTIADWNPVSAATMACRELFGNMPALPPGEAAWPMANPVLATVGWSVLLLLIFVPLAVRRFRTAGL
ncbi:ABC transporter permease [Amycolatopsis aidingensis]|uniref:ABC transporter permease n=1 Tax=Amycolatopsis aidingensis TaxID=2842453 RepID=UPI001C0E642E|nr:ABC transporter permease [Amycolatopsis aidingensis]